MKKSVLSALIVCLFLAFSLTSLSAADAKAGTLTCVGLYSETSDGQVSFKVGSGQWTAIKLGDIVPANAQVKINVDRDWVEFIATGKPAAVWELDGPQSGGEIVKNVADILKSKARAVTLPNGTKAKPDAKYKDKLIVTKYLGRQIFISADGDSKDIRYGDALPRGSKVKIIATNNTLELMNSAGASTIIVGPLNFTVDQVLDNKSLYKYLNVQK